jgi:hypothetical protein
LVDDSRRAHGLPETWQIAYVRAEDDRIIVVCEDGANPFWFSEKMCPPIKLTQDKIYTAALRVPPGSWGTVDSAQPQMTTMLTRSRAASGKPTTFHVILQVRPAGDLCDLGEISEFDEAVPAAIQRGGIPEKWDIAVADVNPARIIVACHPVRVDSMENFSLNRTWAKTEPKFTIPPPPKPKANVIPLPEKLVCLPPDAAFAPKVHPVKVPGTENQELGYQHFKTFVPHQVLPNTPSVSVLVQVE